MTCYNCGRKGHYRWNCRHQSRLPTPYNWRNQDQEMKNPERQLPRYVEERQDFDCDLRHRKGQYHDGWRINQIRKQEGYSNIRSEERRL